jgi:energy-coupling factor transporter ATP-binding protein EcfA2
MTVATAAIIETNPFATRFVRPGAIPFIFPPGQDVGQLIEYFRRNGSRGQIVGPHGSGKSTLAATLLAAFRDSGARTIAIQVHAGDRRLPSDWRCVLRRKRPDVLLIDGFEQLSIWQQFQVNRLCGRSGIGLLVTAHESVGLPNLFRTDVTAELAVRVAKHLLGSTHSRVDPEEVMHRRGIADGNLREALFELYDLFEQRRGATIVAERNRFIR